VKNNPRLQPHATALIVVKQGDDMTAIRDAIHVLDLATRRFAELMMDAAVQAIRGEDWNGGDHANELLIRIQCSEMAPAKSGFR
jgi:hypothetical protein